MKRQMKEGNFQGRRRRHGGTGARGDFGVQKLVPADDEGKREARRLGMATSDDEESGDERRYCELQPEQLDALYADLKKEARRLGIAT